jgi:hypothetical protein
MSLRRWTVAVVLGCWLLGAASARSAIYTQEEGNWPKDWPAELEPLRGSARTIGVATGIQENIYEIPIADRATLDRVWPAVLKLHTHGGRVTLSKAGQESHPDWGSILDNRQAAIRIYAPSGGYTSKDAADPDAAVDYEQLIKEGKALRADAPWPAELIGKQGELPEYVVSTTDADGKMTWKSGAVPSGDDVNAPFLGFLQRARIDIELVVDGEIINLNELPLPTESTVRDIRFGQPDKK